MRKFISPEESYEPSEKHTSAADACRNFRGFHQHEGLDEFNESISEHVNRTIKNKM